MLRLTYQCVWPSFLAQTALRSLIFKASQPRGRASGSRACERHEMQGVIIKSTELECYFPYTVSTDRVAS